MTRQETLQSAIRLELLSAVWIAIEAVASAIAAFANGSLALSVFSADSGVELISGLVVLSRVWQEAHRGASDKIDQLERVASAIVALCLLVLASIIALRAGQALARHAAPAQSWLGLAVALASSIVTPSLAIGKRRLGLALHSHALLGDAACGFTCAYMAWSLLAGVLFKALFGWWWADSATACLILYFVLREALDSGAAAWSGRAHQH